MTTTSKVERIDVFECPNIEDLQRSQRQAIEGGELPPAAARFEEVKYFDKGGRQIREYGETCFPYIVGIRRLGNRLGNEKTKHLFVVTIFCSLGTFEGQLDLHSRKGSLGKID